MQKLMKNKKNVIILLLLIIGSLDLIAQPADNSSSFIDTRDGKTYKTIKIGNQIWMAENLAFKAPEGCMAVDNIESNVNLYGYLYNWETAKKVCPEGWHLSTDEEWTQLTEYMGDEADKKLKDSSGWFEERNGINSSGFSALPGGCSPSNKIFQFSGYYGLWWTSTLADERNAWYRIMGYNQDTVVRDDGRVNYGYSIRCIKD